MTEAPALIRLASPDGRFAAWIAPDQGAELCSLEWEGRELLYRGRDFSPTTGWTGRAPILWPAIGRTFALGSEPTADTFKQAPLGWTVDGVDYPMPMHGFARSLPWAVEASTSSSLRLVLADNDQTRTFYPFGFLHTLDYALTDRILTVRHKVEAASCNTGPMPFVLGNHATFNLNLGATITSNATHRMALDAAGRPTGHTIADDAFVSPMPVTAIETFDVIALLANHTSPWARLTTPSGPSVTVGHQASDRSLSSLEHLTLWGDPGGGYLSLEAWLGKPNALATGDGACSLCPGASAEWVVSIEVEQAG